MTLMHKVQYPVVFLLEAIGDQLWGFKPNFVAALVMQEGPRRALFWFAKNMPKYEHILEAWGPIRTHLVVAVLSTMNGCAYTTAGHAYALQLHYLKNNDRLFPLTGSEIFELHLLPEEEILQRLEPVLIKAGLSEEIFLLHRMVELRREKSLALSDRDYSLLHLIKLFRMLNVCGISNEIKIDQAHDPINKNRAVRDRYAALRKSQAHVQPVVPSPAFGITVLSPEDYL